MAASRRRQQQPHRFGQPRAMPALPPPGPDPAPTRVLERALALAAVDRVLGLLLARPRLVQAAGLVVGLLLIALTWRPLFVSAPPIAPVVPVALTQSPSQSPAPGTADQAVVTVVAAYNQASITAAVLGRADAMAPYLAPDGQAWADVQAEYQHRATRGETHDPALRRWGILRVAVDADTAIVETQEQWDDLTSVGGQVVSSQRG